MNRRSFLKFLGTGAALGVVAATLPTQAVNYFWNLPLSQYADYVSFSQAELTKAMDETLCNVAAELGRRAALQIDNLYLEAYDGRIAA